MSYLKSGEHHTRYYNIKSRCYKTSHPFYKDYGGRGIKMSDEWKNNKKDFIWWCENSNNKRTSRIIEYNGIKKTVTQWSTFMGYKPALVSDRLDRGWSIKKAIETKI